MELGIVPKTVVGHDVLSQVFRNMANYLIGYRVVQAKDSRKRVLVWEA